MNNVNASPGQEPREISTSSEWILREAAGNPKLIHLIGAREEEAAYLIETGAKSVPEQTELRRIVTEIAAEKARMGLDPLIHPDIDYGQQPPSGEQQAATVRVNTDN